MAEDHRLLEARVTRLRLAVPPALLALACVVLLGLAFRFWPYLITDDAYIS